LSSASSLTRRSRVVVARRPSSRARSFDRSSPLLPRSPSALGSLARARACDASRADAASHSATRRIRVARLAIAFASARARSMGDARVTALADAFRDDFDVPHVTAREAMARVANGARGGRACVLVDVRDAEERAVSVIEGAMDAEAYERAREGLGAHDAICYCTIGYRSGKYAEKMAKRANDGDAKYFNMYGSILAWTHEGGTLVEPSTGLETKRVHTYGKQWACAADGYEVVYFKNPLAKGLGQMVRGLFRKKK
jgi:sodium/bile acid cotransporter 7